MNVAQYNELCMFTHASYTNIADMSKDKHLPIKVVASRTYIYFNDIDINLFAQLKYILHFAIVDALYCCLTIVLNC